MLKQVNECLSKFSNTLLFKKQSITAVFTQKIEYNMLFITILAMRKTQIPKQKIKNRGEIENFIFNLY